MRFSHTAVDGAQDALGVAGISMLLTPK